jgi:hypothetical protein
VLLSLCIFFFAISRSRARQGETAEERRLRKKQLKEERRERRQAKKVGSLCGCLGMSVSVSVCFCVSVWRWQCARIFLMFARTDSVTQATTAMFKQELQRQENARRGNSFNPAASRMS